jgi:copper(I)-binding protein
MFNPDFHPQGPIIWRTAQAERTEAFRLLKLGSDYAEAWEIHTMDHCCSQGVKP